MCHGVRFGRTFRFSIAWAVLILSLTFAARTHAATLTVPAGGNLQDALNAAQAGDTIVLQAGAEYVCNSPCILPVKAGTEYVSIVSSRVAEISGRAPATASPLFARVRSFYSTEPVFATAPGAHHYRIAGLDIAPSQSANAYSILALGDGGASQNTLAKVPQFFIIEKNWIHGWPDRESQRAIALSSGNTIIRDNSITEIHGLGYDTQAIACWNGPGPYEITNNLLIGAGENVMFGGSPASIPNLIPSDITVRNNHFLKPLSWYVNDPSYAGRHWSVKNLFELKNARRVLVEGNIFEGNWTDAQAGRAIVFTPRPNDSGSWAVVEDVDFRNNIVKDVASGILILGHDEAPAPTETRLRRVKVTNNIFLIDGPRFGSNGVFATVIARTEDVTIEHNTAVQTGNIISTDYEPNVRFIFRDNISRHNEYGIMGSGHSMGNDTIAYYFPNSVISANVIAKEVNSPWNVESIYPAGNYYPGNLDAVGFVDWYHGNFRLASHSPYKGAGTGGTDPGCNIDALNAALNGTASPSPTPTPTPTPTATPTPTPSPSPSPNTPPAVSITSPLGSTNFVSGDDISIAANASDADGIARVEFYKDATLIGTSTISPYSYAWASVPKGRYELTAKAVDNRGASTTSASVSIGVFSSPTSVKRAKGHAASLATNVSNTSGGYEGAAGSPVESELGLTLAALTADIQFANDEFQSERTAFGTLATQIDDHITASLLFSKGNASLAMRTPTSATIRLNLQRIAAHLAMAEDLMIYSAVMPITATAAAQVNARLNVTIGSAISGYGVNSASAVAPVSLATIATTSLTTPITTQTTFAALGRDGSLPFELAGVSVAVGGVTVPLLYVSPGRVMFYMPSEIQPGTAQVIVTSQDGYVSTALAIVALNATRIMTTADDDNGVAVALNSMTHIADAFDVKTDQNFGTDKRTRLNIFATGINGSAANWDPTNDVNVRGSVRVNFAESVMVEARLSDGRVFNLPVEFAGSQGVMPGLDQVTVVLIPQLERAGAVQLTFLVGGLRSNAPKILVR